MKQVYQRYENKQEKNAKKVQKNKNIFWFQPLKMYFAIITFSPSCLEQIYSFKYPG